MVSLDFFFFTNLTSALYLHIDILAFPIHYVQFHSGSLISSLLIVGGWCYTLDVHKFVPGRSRVEDDKSIYEGTKTLSDG